MSGSNEGDPLYSGKQQNIGGCNRFECFAHHKLEIFVVILFIVVMASLILQITLLALFVQREGSWHQASLDDVLL